jgi:hypothetical protein
MPEPYGVNFARVYQGSCRGFLLCRQHKARVETLALAGIVLGLLDPDPQRLARGRSAKRSHLSTRAEALPLGCRGGSKVSS